MKNLIFVLMCLFYWHSALAKPTLPIEGSWQIVSYQVVGYPAMSQINMKNWVGKLVEFTSHQSATLGNEMLQTCSKFNYQVTTENAEGYFLIGYKIKPHRLGIVEEEIQLVNIACQTDSWLGKNREFVVVNNELMLSYWEGTIFFFFKSADSTLLITPQSVGFLDPDSNFDKNTITRALSDYSVKYVEEVSKKVSEKVSEEVSSKPAKPAHFKLNRQEGVIEIYPNPDTGKIARIRIFDEKALVPTQAKKGATYTQVFRSREKIVDCQAGTNDRQGQTLCSFQNMSSIQYVFEPKSGNDISPIEALNQAKLVEIVWNADRRLIVETAFP